MKNTNGANGTTAMAGSTADFPPSEQAQHAYAGRAAERAAKVPCGSGWTGDRCTKALGHGGAHSNEGR